LEGPLTAHDASAIICDYRKARNCTKVTVQVAEGDKLVPFLPLVLFAEHETFD